MTVSGNLGRKVPVVVNHLSSRKREIYLRTSLKGKCLKFNFQTDRNHYVDLRLTYLALKRKFVKGRVYETFNTKQVEKERKEEAKANEETAVAEEE